MPYAEHDGVKLAYERDGVATGESVVLVEGLGYGRWMWDWQRTALTDDYDVILWDNRGTGASMEPEGPYSISAMAGDLEAVLTDAGVDEAHVVGASMGGMIAQQYVVEYDRATSLTLLCTSHGGDQALATPDETLARMFNVPEEYDEAESIRYKMEPAFTDEFWANNPDLIDDIVAERLETDASDRAREWQAAAVEAFDASSHLDEFHLPTLVMHGERDEVLPVENGRQLAEAIPDADARFFDEGGSHLFFIERASSVNDRLVTFLEQV
ncbi:alpha/beta fold hydrolase [Halobacteriales archaeon Cl-PHB]